MRYFTTKCAKYSLAHVPVDDMAFSVITLVCDLLDLDGILSVGRSIPEADLLLET
jgi:hypothetical protein